MRERAKSGARTQKKARGGRDEGEKKKEKWRLQTTHVKKILAAPVFCLASFGFSVNSLNRSHDMMASRLL